MKYGRELFVASTLTLLIATGCSGDDSGPSPTTEDAIVHCIGDGSVTVPETIPPAPTTSVPIETIGSYTVKGLATADILKMEPITTENFQGKGINTLLDSIYPPDDPCSGVQRLGKLQAGQPSGCFVVGSETYAYSPPGTTARIELPIEGVANNSVTATLDIDPDGGVTGDTNDESGEVVQFNANYVLGVYVVRVTNSPTGENEQFVLLSSASGGQGAQLDNIVCSQ